MHVVTSWDARASKTLLARNSYHPGLRGPRGLRERRARPRQTSPPTAPSFSDATVRLRASGRAAVARRSACSHGAGLDPCAATSNDIRTRPRARAKVTFIFGEADDAEQARVYRRYRDAENVKRRSKRRAHVGRLLTTIQVETPDSVGEFLARTGGCSTRALCCRIWGRCGFYQSSGAYGFRDQLQDSLALVYSVR